MRKFLLFLVVPTLAFAQFGPASKNIVVSPYMKGVLKSANSSAARTALEIAGGGGVLSFTVGNLSPLFTSNVTSGATPAVTFTISNAAPNLVLAGPATGGSGPLTVRALVTLDIPTTLRGTTFTGDVLINPGTANLFLTNTSTGFQSASSGVVTLQLGNDFRNQTFTPGIRGWHIDDDGDAEFNNLNVRGEIRGSVFKINEISATAGTFGVFYSAGTAFADFTTPGSISTSFTFIAKNSDAGATMFGIGDIVRFKTWTGAGISDSWATVTARTNNGTNTTYTATLNSGSTSATFRAGTAIVDYGPTGSGFITQSADGTIGSSPNLTMATHSGSPWSVFTTLLREGNLNGSYGYTSNVYGIGIGQYGSGAWQTFDTTNGIRLGFGTAVNGQWDINGNLTLGNVATGQANAFWNNTNKHFEFRGGAGGTVVQSYINTDGSFVTGGGNVTLNSTGLSLISTTAANTYNMVTWHTIGNPDPTMQLLNVYTGGGASIGALRARNKTTDTTTTSAAGLEALGATSAKATSFYVVETQASDSGYAYVTNTGTFTGFRVGSGSPPTHMLDVDGIGSMTGLRVNGSTPASSGAACEAGTVTWDASFVYVCTASGGWKRSALSTW